MLINNITLGSDPEFGCFDESGTPRSAVDFIPGTKQDPFPLTPDGEYSIQIDNVGVEGCVPPTKTREEFINSIVTVKKLVNAKLQEIRPDYHIESVSSARFHPSELKSKTAKTFGCDPSYCVYTKGVSPRPSPEEVGNLRSFGFHVHIGFNLLNDDNPIDTYEKLIKCMDIQAGVGSILIDQDNDRRSIYGNAGDFRFRMLNPTLHVVEYRTLGGAMSKDEESIGWVYDRTMDAIDMLNNWKNEYDELSVKAGKIIDNGDVQEAISFLNDLKIEIPHGILENQKQTSIA